MSSNRRVRPESDEGRRPRTDVAPHRPRGAVDRHGRAARLLALDSRLHRLWTRRARAPIPASRRSARSMARLLFGRPPSRVLAPRQPAEGSTRRQPGLGSPSTTPATGEAPTLHWCERGDRTARLYSSDVATAVPRDAQAGRRCCRSIPLRRSAVCGALPARDLARALTQIKHAVAVGTWAGVPCDERARGRRGSASAPASIRAPTGPRPSLLRLPEPLSRECVAVLRLSTGVTRAALPMPPGFTAPSGDPSRATSIAHG